MLHYNLIYHFIFIYNLEYNNIKYNNLEEYFYSCMPLPKPMLSFNFEGHGNKRQGLS